MLNTRKKSTISTLSLAALLAVGAVATTRPAIAAELVVNGSFEQGTGIDATGWGDLFDSGAFSDDFFRTGTRAWGAGGSLSGTISQTITGLTAGQSATISFWVANENFSGGIPNGLNVGIGSLSLFNLSNTPAASNAPGTFANFTTTFVSLSTAPLLLFSGFNNPGGIWVDDVSITVADTPTAVPEPSAVVGLAAMGALLAGSAKKRFERK